MDKKLKLEEKVFYLKYRPQKIDDLDLKNIRDQLSLTLNAKIIPHAFLLSGPKGLGKTSAARIIAKVINCEAKKRQGIEPCNHCSACQSITKGTALDLMEIDAASNRGIDDIRELKEKIKLAPTQSKKKIYVIDEVHMLTKEAFNALLKTLEEPPSHAFFILCTTEPEKLPETIISRCQRFNFIKAEDSEIVRSLKRIVKGEKLKVDEEALFIISRHADGSFRDATKILQQLSLGNKKITLAKTEALLEQEMIFSKELLKTLVTKSTGDTLIKLNKIVKQGADLKILIYGVLEELRQIILKKFSLAPKANDYGLSLDEVKTLISLFSEAGGQLRNSFIPKLVLEMAIIEYHNLKTLPLDKTEMNKPANPANEDALLLKWQQVLKLVKLDNHSIEALLKSTRVKELNNQEIIVEVFYDFHKKKLESNHSMMIIEKRVKEIFLKPLKIKYLKSRR